MVRMFAANAFWSAPTVESDAQISGASSQKSSCPSVRKSMYLSPGVVSAASALAVAVSAYIAGDSSFLPVFMASLGFGHMLLRLSYLVLMSAAFINFGMTLSASAPDAASGHDPPPVGL